MDSVADCLKNVSLKLFIDIMGFIEVKTVDWKNKHSGFCILFHFCFSQSFMNTKEPGFRTRPCGT